MTKVLIVSDSHGLTEELSEIKARHQVDCRIHCGDSELDFNSSPLKGFYKVAGNCDVDNQFPHEQIIEIDTLRFLIVHGHRHQVHQGLLHLSLRAKEVGANVVCFGHTHVAGAIKEGEQFFINPGSIRQSRGIIKEKTYAILEWDQSNTLTVTYYTVDGERYKELDLHTVL